MLVSTLVPTTMLVVSSSMFSSLVSLVPEALMAVLVVEIGLKVTLVPSTAKEEEKAHLLEEKLEVLV